MIRTSFTALRHRNFRLLWLGQMISMSGSVMQTAAVLWHVSLLSEPSLKAVALGAVGLGRVVPIILFSMALRNVIRQLETPDHLRGRMIGVNMVFFMGGPQPGELEAGLVANLFGAAFSVVSGGTACLDATAWVALRNPALRAYRRSSASQP